MTSSMSVMPRSSLLASTHCKQNGPLKSGVSRVPENVVQFTQQSILHAAQFVIDSIPFSGCRQFVHSGSERNSKVSVRELSTSESDVSDVALVPLAVLVPSSTSSVVCHSRVQRLQCFFFFLAFGSLA